MHDNIAPGASSPLVNWTTANDLAQTTVDYVRVQFDRLGNRSIRGQSAHDLGHHGCHYRPVLAGKTADLIIG